MRRLLMGWSGRLEIGAARRSLLGRFSLLITILAVSGCSFTPEPPPELNEIKDTLKIPTITVEMILAGDDIDDRLFWEQAARLEASNAKAVFSIARKTNAEPPAKMAELIRSAIKRGVTALVVEPVEGSEFVEAVNDARDQGVSVVLLDKVIPGRDPSKTYPAVIYTPFEEPAGKVVDALIKRAAADGLPADGTALVLVNPTYAPDTEYKVATLTKALEKAGVTKVERLEYNGKFEEVQKTLTAKLESDPKITLVIGHEENGITGAVNTRKTLKPKRKFEVAGTASVDRILAAEVIDATPGIADRNVSNLARQALKVAVAMAKGEAVPPETLLPLPYISLTPSDKVAEERAAKAAAGPPDPALDREKSPKK